MILEFRIYHKGFLRSITLRIGEQSKASKRKHRKMFTHWFGADYMHPSWIKNNNLAVDTGSRYPLFMYYLRWIAGLLASKGK